MVKVTNDWLSRKKMIFFCQKSFPVLVLPKKGGEGWEKRPVGQDRTTGDRERWREVVNSYPIQWGPSREEQDAAYEAARPYTALGFIPGSVGMAVIDADGPESVRWFEHVLRRLGLDDHVASVSTGRGKHYYYAITKQFMDRWADWLPSRNGIVEYDAVIEDALDLGIDPRLVHIDWRCGGNMFLIAPWSKSHDGVSKVWSPDPGFPLADDDHAGWWATGGWRDLVHRRLPALQDELLEELTKYAPRQHETKIVASGATPDRRPQPAQEDKPEPRHKIDWCLEHLERMVSGPGGALPLDDRQTWINVATALKAAGATQEDFGRICWREMSPREVAQQWASFDPANNRTRLGTVIKLIEDTLGVTPPWGGRPPEIDPADLTPPERAIYDYTIGERVDLDALPASLVAQDRSGRRRFRLTLQTVDYLLALYGLRVYVEETLKREIVELRAKDGSVLYIRDHAALLAIIQTILKINNLTRALLPADKILAHLLETHRRNIIREWLDALPEQGDPTQFERLVSAIVVDPEQETQKRVYLRKFLRQCIASQYGELHQAKTGLPYSQRGVLMLQGPQGIGKTTLYRLILPDLSVPGNPHLPLVYLDGAQIVPGNKDLIMQATSSWVTEIGEAEQTLSKTDQAAIKAFLTSSYDTYRAPYARNAQTYPRRTVFVGSVNVDKFLADETGSDRYWVLNVTSIDRAVLRSIDKIALWAWAKADYLRALEEDPEHSIYLTREEHAARATINATAESDNPWIEVVTQEFGDLSQVSETDPGSRWMSLIEIAQLFAREGTGALELVKDGLTTRSRRLLARALKAAGAKMRRAKGGYNTYLVGKHPTPF